MRTLVCLLILLPAAGAWGQSDDPDNAATWYAKAIQAFESLPPQVLDTIYAYDWSNPHAVVTDELRLALAQAQPILRMTRKGSRRAYSDFALDYGQGFELTLPHLGRLRNITQLMRTDAIVRLYDGDTSAAAAEVATLYRLAGHIGEDRVVISSLVGNALFRAAEGITQIGFDRGAFTSADSAKLLQAIKTLGSNDPFDFVGAIETEKDFVVEWLRDKYADPADRLRMFDQFASESDELTMIAGLAMVDQTEFEGALDQVERLMDRVVEVFSMSDPVEAQFELHQIAKEIRRGDHGLLAVILVPAFSKIYERMIQGEEQITERTARLEAIISGAATPAELANAAVWYLRAIQMLNTIEPTRRQQFRTVVADPGQPIGEERAETLSQAEAIVETLRAGSQKSRCDFSIARRGRPSAIPSYLPGIREAVRLLLADAVRLLQQRETAAAADRLVIGYRMSAHLAGDKVITASLVSHVMFTALDALAGWALAQDAFSDTQRSALLGAVETMSRKDPFGYIAGITSAREQVHKWIVSSAPRIPGEDTPRARELVRGLDGDQLLYMLIVRASPADGSKPAQSNSRDSLRGLDDVISLENLTLALTQAQDLRRAIESGAFDGLSDRAVPEIANVRQRLASARADLRRSVFSLKTKPTLKSAPAK
ncbi:MAG: hypothetical protein IH889_05155 [Planctomycetes bacterium]|nr:hypothetical protein [Planctomycetota bacterium]